MEYYLSELGKDYPILNLKLKKTGGRFFVFLIVALVRLGFILVVGSHIGVIVPLALDSAGFGTPAGVRCRHPSSIT